MKKRCKVVGIPELWDIDLHWSEFNFLSMSRRFCIFFCLFHTRIHKTLSILVSLWMFVWCQQWVVSTTCLFSSPRASILAKDNCEWTTLEAVLRIIRADSCAFFCCILRYSESSYTWTTAWSVAPTRCEKCLQKRIPNIWVWVLSWVLCLSTELRCVWVLSISFELRCGFQFWVRVLSS